MARRLAAILAADVVGFSRLMEIDEAGTLAALQAHRAEFIDPLIARSNGRIVKLMGDGALVEFASVVDAVACAVAIQQGMAERNAGISGNKRIDFRIGVNLGDVIVEGDDIYGDGVNVAARLEALATPGSVCISGTVRDHIAGKLQHEFADGGEQTVKNMSRPVHVWRWSGGVSAPASAPVERAVGPISNKPSIAVLPFNNMSGDPEQEYFSDGITEDIITELSRFTGLFVISRNSCFTFKGQAVDVREAGQRLGARFVVEGSVRKVADRIRVTAQLVESATGNHLWAQRYDRNLYDIFAVQDELVNAISGVIPGQLDRVGVEDSRRKTPSNLTAYDCELRGRWALNHWNEGPSVALAWFEKAIKADPDYALAHAGAAMAYSYGLFLLGLPSDVGLAHAKGHAHRAIALDERNPKVNAYAAFTFHLAAEYKLARTYAERAVALNPNDPFVLFIQASTLLYAGGDPEQALEWFRKSEQIEAYAPDDYRVDTLEDCYYLLHDYRKVVEIHAIYNLPAFLKLILAAAFAQLGELENARCAVEEYERTRPAGHDAIAAINFQIRMCARQEDRDNWLEGYRKAGLPV